MNQRWLLDPNWTFLNHGSFGARLASVHLHQEAWRKRLEAQPLRFFLDAYLPALEEARRACGELVGADAEDLVFVPNATYGVNSVLRSLEFAAGDEILVLDHAYDACRVALDHLAAGQGAVVVPVTLPFPCRGEQQVVDTVLAACTARTRLALLDAVTSPSAWVLPIEAMVSELKLRGIESLVDAAHSPGMVAMDLRCCGAAYTTGNLHKWICAPLGSAFLHVRKDRQNQTLPSSLSHGLRLAEPERWSACFDWTGTFDPSAWLSLPFAIDQFAQLDPDGAAGVMAANQALARQARAMLIERLDLQPTCPESMLGSMASLLLPVAPAPLDHHLATDPLQRWLAEQHRIEVAVLTFAGRRLLRISCQRYNQLDDYAALTSALREGLAQAS